MKYLTPELKSLVDRSVTVLGEVLQHELGSKSYQRIEKIRHDMTRLRGASEAKSFLVLNKLFSKMEDLPSQQRREIATAFTLMLELMNTCENAYRTHRLQQKSAPAKKGSLPEAVIYVLTAHPTEARSPDNIFIFHQIQSQLIRLLDDPEMATEELRHLLEVAWRTSIVRNRSPRVRDEAEHIYSTLFRDEVFEALLEVSQEGVPFYLRTWVGGDKDGHPGVNEKTLMESLTLSRAHLLRLVQKQLAKVHETLHLFPSDPLRHKVILLQKESFKLRRLQGGDARRLAKYRQQVRELSQAYTKVVGSSHPALMRVKQMFYLFPALVVPLELRESSDVLMSPENPHKKLAIDKMLAAVAKLSGNLDPRWYARGFIISMAESLAHVRKAAEKQKKAFGDIRLPIIPLFEEASSLKDSPNILRQMIQDPIISKAARKNWDSQIELMVGYSDSSKEAGVLASRLAIAKSLPILEKICLQKKFKPIFFHGSGGSVDRGGGSVENQTAWWPRSALNNYKVTVQGEMVERSLATPQIARGQIEHIVESISRGLTRKNPPPVPEVLTLFAENVSHHYREQITSPSFLKLVEEATPYSYLRFLKMGSRPVKRSTTLTVSGLRAIPWILCWTQTRILFPTWWGVGSAWNKTSPADRKKIKQAFRAQPAFQSYVKALGFTLAKAELPIWHLYLEKSRLPQEQKEQAFQDFSQELALVKKFFTDVSGQKDLTFERPWLGESIHLRAPMIHPLNILQILAEKSKDVHLLRITATGISSGMLTTG